MALAFIRLCSEPFFLSMKTKCCPNMCTVWAMTLFISFPECFFSVCIVVLSYACINVRRLRVTVFTSLVRSEFKIKLKNINKKRMVIVNRVFISEDFLVNPLLSQMHLLRQSNYRLKAVAYWSMPMFRPTPPRIFLKLSRVKTVPASTSFKPQKKK